MCTKFNNVRRALFGVVLSLLDSVDASEKLRLRGVVRPLDDDAFETPAHVRVRVSTCVCVYVSLTLTGYTLTSSNPLLQLTCLYKVSCQFIHQARSQCDTGCSDRLLCDTSCLDLITCANKNKMRTPISQTISRTKKIAHTNLANNLANKKNCAHQSRKQTKKTRTAISRTNKKNCAHQSREQSRKHKQNAQPISQCATNLANNDTTNLANKQKQNAQPISQTMTQPISQTNGKKNAHTNLANNDTNLANKQKKNAQQSYRDLCPSKPLLSSQHSALPNGSRAPRYQCSLPYSLERSHNFRHPRGVKIS